MAGTAVHLVMPLCERRASARTTLAKLLAWRTQARSRAASINFTDLDGGPDAEELHMEIDWLLDDAVAESGKHSGWKQLKTFAQNAGTSNAQYGHMQVSLRASLEELDQLWKERIEQRRPFQYIVGCAHWRDFVLGVQEGVLIPRPETEQLVDLAAAAMESNNGYLRSGIWADLGTGSGAIAIGIAQALRGNGSVVAVDMSDIAVAVSNANIHRYKLQEVVSVVKGSWWTPLQDKLGELSGIVSNPPYIPSERLPGLQAEVGRHEPKSALDGGVDGTDHLIQICDGACWALKPGGFLALETDGDEQAQAIAKYLSNKEFRDIEVVKDFAEIDRFVTAFHL